MGAEKVFFDGFYLVLDDIGVPKANRDVDKNRKAENKPKMKVLGLVAENLHAKQATKCTAKNAEQEQCFFWYALPTALGLGFIIAKEDEGDDADGDDDEVHGVLF